MLPASEKNRLLIKALLIGALVLLMLIPSALIHNLVRERQVRQEQVTEEVTGKWAHAQTVTGPVLIVPYMYTYKGPAGTPVSIRKLAHFLPDGLRIDGNVTPEPKHRSLYHVTVYRSTLRLEGTFPAPPLATLGIDPATVLWNEARLLIGVNDLRGLEEEVTLDWNGTAGRPEGGVPENGAIKEGISIPVSMGPNAGATFRADMKLRGSRNLYFTPVGRTTEVTLRSQWQHPAFDGKYLPDTTAFSNAKGFTARWKILAMSRSYPQAWKETVDLQSAAFGVRLIQPADGYSKTERSVKYAILFISLTFLVFFFLEILQKKQIHPLQYLLVGFALCIFYTLLLSVSEYAGFNTAYAVASTATVALIGLYVWSIFNSGKTALGFTTALGGLYGYIYIIIQLEDYSLLFGSIGLFVILAIIMYYSRRIDWYGAGKAAL